VKAAVARRVGNFGVPSGLLDPEERLREQREGQIAAEVRRKTLEERIALQKSLKPGAEAVRKAEEEEARRAAGRKRERFNDEEVKRIDGEMEELSAKKRELFWLLKVTINEESGRAREKL